MLGESHAFASVYDAELDAHRGSFTHIVAFDVLEHIYFALGAGLNSDGIRAPALPTNKLGLRWALRRHCALLLRFVIESVVGYAYFGRRVSFNQSLLVVIVREPEGIPH